MGIKLNKNHLDSLGTFLGLIAGISTVLGTQDIIDPKIAGAISGVATVCLGYVVQRPANISPTTEETEEKNIGHKV